MSLEIRDTSTVSRMLLHMVRLFALAVAHRFGVEIVPEDRARSVWGGGGNPLP